MEYQRSDEEFKLILSRYKDIQCKLRPRATKEQKREVRKAFTLAFNAHKDMRRRSGEPYILHPIEVANIVLDNMNLGATSVICALLHDTVEDTDYTLQDIETLFGSEVATIIDGLTKIDDVSDTPMSRQFETFKKILLTMSKDARVILIKLADRLHNMRTLDAMPQEKQMKIASETLYMYAPLAHRLGFYNIKSELEDLAMKYQDPGSFNYISDCIKNTEKDREIFIEQFIAPIREQLVARNFKFEIASRTKSIYSIWQKMTKKRIPFDEVYDLFAIRIIIEADDEHQKSACWSVYSIVTDIYKPKADRLRDWISMPKANGYQSLHTTVMSNKGKWVEVQIRTRQMDTIAENGFAAHWVYKENGKRNDEQGVEAWLASIKEILQNNENVNTGELVSNVKMNLFNKEIFVFTAKGEERTMPENSTVLDFAYEMDADTGNYCIGAKVNNKLVPPSYILKTGDQIEVITSQKQRVQEEWLTFVATAKAVDNITNALGQQRKDKINQGKNMLKDYFNKYNVEITKINRDKLMAYVGYKDRETLYLAIYNKQLPELKIKQCFSKISIAYRIINWIKPAVKWLWGIKNLFTIDNALRRKLSHNPQSLLLGNMHEIKQTIAPCCNPVAGDRVIAFSLNNNEIVVHRANCSEAIQLSARYGDRIVKAKWRAEEEKVEFLAGISLKGFDSKGLVHSITGIIHQDFQVNCRNIQFSTIEGLFEGEIILYIQNVEHLNKLMERLRSIPGIEKVERIYSDDHEK